MDDKSKKQLKIILLLLPVLALVVGKNVIGPHWARREGAPAATVATPATPATPAAPASAASAKRTVLASTGHDAAVKALEAKPWGRNPFGVATPVATPAAPVPSGMARMSSKAQHPAALFKLEGIVWDPDSPYAVIDGEVRVVGDSVSVYQIVGIKKDRVVLRKDDQSFDLRLLPDMR